jgi:hypothetical protein
MVQTRSVRVPRLVRWSLWLLAGVGLGLVLGFAAGLARPHARR